MYEFCCVCLSKRRKLDKLSDEHWDLLLDNVVNKTIKSFQQNFNQLRQILNTCSECRKKMDGIVEFKGMALTGLDYVSQCYLKNPSSSCLILETNKNNQSKVYGESSTFEEIMHTHRINEEPEIEVPVLQTKIEVDTLCEVSTRAAVSDPLNDRSIKIELEEVSNNRDIESMLCPSFIIKENCASGGNAEDKKDKALLSALKTSACEMVTIDRPSESQMVVTVKSEFSDESTDSAEEPLEQKQTSKLPGSQHDAHEIINNPKVFRINKKNNLRQYTAQSAVFKKTTKSNVIRNVKKSNLVQIIANSDTINPQSNSVPFAPKNVLLRITAKKDRVKTLEQKSPMLQFILDNVKTVPTLQVVKNSSVCSNATKRKVVFPNSLINADAEQVEALNRKTSAHNSNQRKGMWYRRIFSEKQAIEQLEQKRNAPEFIDSKIKCEMCVEVFQYETDLVEHLQEMHNEKDCKFVCPICKQRFKATDYLLKIHLKQHYDKYICALCNLEAPSSGVLTHHKCGAINYGSNITLRALDLPKIKEHKCNHCGEFFQDGKTRYRHVISKHRTLPPAQCNICNATFKDKFKVLSHIRRKHQNNDTIDNMAFYCKPCGLRFNNSSTYKFHMKSSLKHISQDDLKFVCDLCGRRFLNEKDLRRHTDLIHLKKKGPHKCAQCPKAFYFARLLKEHVQIIHENMPRPRKYMCEICAQAFTCSATLKDHKNRHTGARPYKCTHCTASFGFKAALYTHIKLVHEKVKRVWKKKKTGKRKTKSQIDCKEKTEKSKVLNENEHKTLNEDELKSLNKDKHPS